MTKFLILRKQDIQLFLEGSQTIKNKKNYIAQARRY